MLEPGTNQRPVCCHVDLRFTITIMFGYALRRGVIKGMMNLLSRGFKMKYKVLGAPNTRRV